MEGTSNLSSAGLRILETPYTDAFVEGRNELTDGVLDGNIKRLQELGISLTGREYDFPAEVTEKRNNIFKTLNH